MRWLGILTLSIAAAAAGAAEERKPAEANAAGYLLGPGDQLTIWARDLEEFSNRPFRVDDTGAVELPLVGRLRAGGLTVGQFDAEFRRRLKTYVREPETTVTISQFRSQPVSVLGAVGTPGVHYLEGRKTLVEALSLAGGLKPDAGNTIKITRRMANGPLPLENAKPDPTGQFSIAEVGVRDLLEARRPQDNIEVAANDVISVPRAEMVYVIGDVNKPGAFPLDDESNIAVLEALSLAGGLTRSAASKNARILRLQPGSQARTEIPVNLGKLLDGKITDPEMQADDILFVPGSKSKTAAVRALEAVISMGTGIAIWRGGGAR